MAEELRLEASVVDKFSRPLRDLKSRLNDVKTPDGVKQMPAHFQKIHESVRKTSEEIRGGLGQALSGLGLSGLAATASVAGVIGAIRGFSASTIEMRQFARETGFTIETLKAFKGAASSFGIDDTIIPGALKNLSSNLRNIRRRVPGTVFDELVRIDPSLLKALTGKNVDQALRIIEEQFASMSKTQEGRQQAGILSEKLFGTSDMARFGLKGKGPLRDALKKFYGQAAPSADDEAKAVQFAQSIEKLQQSFESLRKTVGNELAPAFSDMMESVNKYVEANKGKLGTSIKDALASITEEAAKTDWKQLGGDLAAIGHGLHDIVDTFRSSRDFIDRFLSGKRFGKSGVADDLNEARNKLAEYDKSHAHGVTGLRGASTPEREALVSQVRRLEELQKATAKGVEEGMTGFFQKQSFKSESGGLGGGGGGIINASYGGGRGYGGGGGGGDVEDSGVGRGRNSGAIGRGRREAAMHYMRRLIDVHGYTPEAAAIAAGNAEEESGWRTGAAGDGGISHGLHQWNKERFSALKKFAADRHKAWTDFDTQTDFAAMEMQKKIPWTKGQRDLSRAGRWGHQYEGYSTRTEGDRVRAARGFLEDLKRYKPPAIAQKSDEDQGDADWRNHRGGRVPMPRNMPKPDVGKVDGNRARQPSRLDVIFHNPPHRMNTKANGGDHFERINIDRGRTQMWGT